MSLPEKMKAVVTYTASDIRYEDYPVPQAGPGELVLKVKGTGICAGDIKCTHGGIRFWGTSPETAYVEGPCIQGHEFCGTVEEIGEGVTGYEKGDLVVAEQILPCGECEFCRTGQYWMCTRSAVFGFKQYANGGFAEYVKVPKGCKAHKLPKTFTVEQAALVEPIACGMHAVEQAGIRHDDVVVIAGMGPIGLSMANVANLAMPKCVIAIEVRPERAAMAKEFGADVVLNPLECDVAEEVKKLTGGLGCTVYIEASGNPKSVAQGFDCLANHGRFVQMGVMSALVETDFNTIGDGKELTIIGSHLSALVYPAVIRGIEKGLIRTDGLVTHTFPLSEFKKAYETAEKDPAALKVVLVPDA